jgi:hypothetical protein
MRQTWHLALGTHHEAGCIAQGQHRKAVHIAELHEACRLVGVVRLYGAPHVTWIIGDQTEWPALDAHQRCNHAGAEMRPEFKHGTGICQGVDDFSDIIYT